ncbi:unnamed protein product [Bursaphelenchus okinawaensis]|uniref:TATA-box-binding protein n=1 Tax=Bursaphelenchus okinawaensis TaxID=465554 RepID=A0A811L923_9BILA|nr:unnamed protein product [Bursaphelenchus okinawaensis]CAG9120026.1 unnamed protein product [Bursaphelenchus okinawaensis]
MSFCRGLATPVHQPQPLNVPVTPLSSHNCATPNQSCTPPSNYDEYDYNNNDKLPISKIPTTIPCTSTSDYTVPVPVVENIVSTCFLGTTLNLKEIATQARNAEYNPKRFAAVVMRIREPKTTALIFNSGKVVVTGAKSEVASKLAARKYARIIQKLGFNARFMDFKIQNLVAAVDVQFSVYLEGINISHCQFSTYEPEIFPGLIYRMVAPRVVLLIFVSGKVVITGAQQRTDLTEAFHQIYPILRRFKK